ncbi:serine/threonine protein kinase [Bradymonas sediminis]|uniref:Uncharacterized protein n=1 Tax=Bradymonas sediminis TaxID=1548548 RepID=A0A2Z4FK04_9DELT|nr:serine/threonine-protein kinase [Bradymonas sediminis]AWV89301.1 hypothetical protein DN745_08105 [Bradymonas sediminis]TDP73475.1 serine/threonine protein kinase [Bradymonas sediminis]
MSTPVPDSHLRAQLVPGRLFEQKYRILNELGTGSFAIVVKARHEVMGRDVALKCLKPSVVRARPDVSQRFVTEVKIVSRLRHPNTVTIFDFGHTDQNLAYMVLEYLDGQTLCDTIDAQGPFSQTRAIHIARQILKSLDEAHSYGIVHRDLKPSNIMLTEMHGEPDFVKVLDFGVAKLLDESSARQAPDEPRSTQFIGTPIYMSPEQVLGQPVTPASDLYSLGLLLYQMLAGDPPIAHTSVAAVVREHLDDGPLPFPNLGRLRPEMQKIVLKATARAPQERFATVREFLDALAPRDAAPGAQIFKRPTVQAGAPEGLVSSLGEESSVPDVFSGRNYIEVPHHPDEAPQRTARPAAPRPSLRKTQPGRAQRATTPVPSLRTDELDLDLDAIDRQRRQAERQRRQLNRSAQNSRRSHASNAPAGRTMEQERDARGIDMGVIGQRVLLVLTGFAGAYLGFLILSAMMVGQSTSAKWAAGAAMLAVAVLASRFSGTRVVGGDFAQRWLSPVARNLIIFSALIFIAGLFIDPADTAKALESDPTWFLAKLPAVAPFSWLDTLTSKLALVLAAAFRAAAGM